jgi:hypothetical protein
MFQSVFSPICDPIGDSTVNVIFTPYFQNSPLPLHLSSCDSESKQCARRLFENSSVSYLSDWTTDSEADPEESENEFRWSATP